MKTDIAAPQSIPSWQCGGSLVSRVLVRVLLKRSLAFGVFLISTIPCVIIA